MKTLLSIAIIFPLIVLANPETSPCQQLQEYIIYHRIRPLIQVSHQKKIYSTKSSNVKINALELGSDFAVRLVVPSHIQKAYGKRARYGIKGVSVYKVNPQPMLGQSELIYEDSLFKTSFRSVLVYGFKGLQTRHDLPGTTYRVVFSTLVLIDCENKQHEVGSGFSDNFGFTIETRAEVASELQILGKPSFMLYINGTPLEEEQVVERNDTLTLRVKFRKALPADNRQAHFEIVGYSVHEQGCFGGVTHERMPQSQFPIAVPNDMHISFGGRFCIIICRR